MKGPRRVLVVDDHAVVRRGTMEIVADHPDGFEFVEAGSVAEALDALEGRDFDLVLLDISLPDASGFDLLRRLAELRPGLPALVLSMHSDPEYARRALGLGARGYLTKDSAPEELAEALDRVLAGGVHLSPSLTRRSGASSSGPFPAGPPQALLSRREYEVMYRLARGDVAKRIASDMGLSAKTVSTYRARIMKKLSLRTTADFFRYALENGLFVR